MWTGTGLSTRRPGCRLGREGGVREHAISARTALAFVEEQHCGPVLPPIVRCESALRLRGDACLLIASVSGSQPALEDKGHGLDNRRAPYVRRGFGEDGGGVVRQGWRGI